MIVKYENSIDDLVAFSRHHYARSPAVKWSIIRSLVLWSLVFIFISLKFPTTDDLSISTRVAFGILYAALFCLIVSLLRRPITDRLVRRMFREGDNKGIICQHELEIDDQGIVERTEVGEARQSWRAVERIEESDDHAFIYVSSMMAHVIPKRAVETGDVQAFLSQAKEWWRAANVKS